MATVMPILLIAVALAWVVLFVYTRFGQVMIDVGGQGSPQQIYFGTEYRAQDVSRFVVPLEAVAGTFFMLIAGTFLGLGQAMGRAFAGVPNRVTAYTVNIAGSLVGIVAMAVLSYLQTPPEVWFAIGLALCLSASTGPTASRRTRSSSTATGRTTRPATSPCPPTSSPTPTGSTRR